MTSPCKDCADRNTFCHSSCDKYNAYREKKDRDNEKRRRENDLMYALDHAEIERAKKMKKKR